MNEGDAIVAVAIMKPSGEWNEHAALHKKPELLVGISEGLRDNHVIAASYKSRELGLWPAI